MNRDRRSKKRNTSNQSSQNNSQGRRRDENNKGRRQNFKPTPVVSLEQIHEEEAAIRMFKAENQPVCALCGKPITDLASAMQERGGGDPIHFECAMEQLSSSEKLDEGDKIAYIGQGRFAVLNYPNIRDVRTFSIKKIIEWEDRNEKPVWRNDMAELFSHVR